MEYNIVSKIISSYNNTKRIESGNKTFAEVYKLYYADKYENPNSKKNFSKSSINAYNSAYKKCTALYDKPMKSITKTDMQSIIDSCILGYGSLVNLKNLFSQMFAYSLQNGIVEMDYSRFVTINTEKDFETGEPFTEHEIKLLWQNKDNQDVQIILILIYTGMRIGELEVVGIDYTENYFKGGLKTPAGKDRIIPFPDSIMEYIKTFNQKSFNAGTFRDKKFYNLIQSIGMDPLTNGKKHTPHDCRHTFSWLCDKYGVDELSKHLLMGHSLGNDVEKSVYGHRTVEQLREEINKITVPNLSLTCC
ncbi:MAG: site-specific integrase [Lachnospiraceae bacterium]|nr:site-specific integrase [Lachnospiraceae bacterium]